MMVIVGGGPAGQSAALILGRCHRQVLLCDDNQQRNRFSKGHPWVAGTRRPASLRIPGWSPGGIDPLQVGFISEDAGRCRVGAGTSILFNRLPSGVRPKAAVAINKALLRRDGFCDW